MDEHIKTALYLYPKLEGMERDYQQHIENKATLSYVAGINTERLAEYIAEQILEKELLLRLKEKMDGVWKKLSALEKEVLSLRFFGRKARAVADGQAAKKQEAGRGETAAKEGATEKPLHNEGAKLDYREIAEGKKRTYFRRVARAIKKVGELMAAIGLTEESFLGEYGGIAAVKRLYSRVKAKS